MFCYPIGKDSCKESSHEGKVMVGLFAQAFSSHPLKTTLGVAINLGGIVVSIAHLLGGL